MSSSNAREFSSFDIQDQNHQSDKKKSYLKANFSASTRQWDKQARDMIGATAASLYSTILVCFYIAFSFTELTKFPENKNFLEIYGFFTYLYIVGTSYLIYIIYIVRWSKNDRLRVLENCKSHGSTTVRIGVIIFGIGAFVYNIFELLSFIELIRDQGPCFYPVIGFNTCLALLFTLLQAYIIFTFPRLNIQCHKIINRFGTMHIVGLNIIVWLRTLIKESLEEIVEYEEGEHHKVDKAEINEHHEAVHGEKVCNSILELLEKAEKETEMCNEFRHDFLGNTAVQVIPYLYPFMIEFALIGASVALIMSKHIGKPKNHDVDARNRVNKPNAKDFLQKADWTHSTKGLVCGLLVLMAAIVNLTTFFGLDGHGDKDMEAELLSKTSNSVINSIGVIACIIGIERIQHLGQKSEYQEDSFDLDEVLLRFGSTFAFLYMIFTIITGAFNGHIEGFPNELHFFNGIIEMVQIILQIIFIHNLKEKALPPEMRESRPGRQVTVFLFLFNVSQWLVFTFEIQKVHASLVEAKYFGFMPWVIIRRVTLPLAVFFRFHSSVVSIELWKEVYSLDEFPRRAASQYSVDHQEEKL